VAKDGRREAMTRATVAALVAAAALACARKDGAPSAPPPDALAPQSVSSPLDADADAAASLPERAQPDAASRVAQGAPSAPVSASDWVWKEHRGDGFRAVFPGEPRLSVLPEDDDKVGYTEARLDVPGGQASFAAGFSDFPEAEVASPESFLDEHASAPRRGTTEIVHRRAVTLPGGHPGRVLILKRNISGTPLRVYSRLYLVGRRLYSLIVSTLDQGGVGEDVVKRFMESFRLS
jgi:hypothetical protein